jgi:hypothetical protein
MGTALVGFIGVIAGAITTGGVSALLAFLSRRRGVLLAARVLSATLLDASVRIGSVVSSKNLGVSDDWAPLLLPWQEHRDNLALAVDPRVYRLVAVAFSNLSLVVSYRQMLINDDTAASADEIDMVLVGFKTNIDLVQPFLEEASYTKRQRRKGLPTAPLIPEGSAIAEK